MSAIKAECIQIIKYFREHTCKTISDQFSYRIEVSFEDRDYLNALGCSKLANPSDLSDDGSMKNFLSMVSRRVAVVTCVTLQVGLVAISARAGDTLVFADGTFSLGMPKEEALRLLESRYKLVKVKQEAESETVLIEEKGSATDTDVGSIVFKDGKVVALTKTWGSFQSGNSIDLAKKLYAVLTQLEEKTGAPVVVSAIRPRYETDLTLFEIRFGDVNHNVDLTFSESQKYKTPLSLTESVAGTH